MKLFLFIVFLTDGVLPQLTYEKGMVSNIKLFNGPRTFTNTITFSNTFQQVPQIIIHIASFSLGMQRNEVNFKITSVSLTNFKYTVTIPYSGYIGSYYFDWLAIVEDRIQVLNPPQETVLTNGAIYTYSHTQSQVTQAAIFLNTIGYVVGGLDIELSVYSISNTNVKIQLKTTTANLRLIGFQVILGTKEAFYATPVGKTGSGNSVLGKYSVKILQNSLFYYPFLGFGWSSNNVRIGQEYSVVQPNYVYSYLTYSGTIMNSVTFQSIQFFTQILFPYYVKKYVVSKQFLEFPTDLILVKFIELNQSFNSDTSQTLNLLSTQTLLNVQIQITLSKGKKVEGFMLKCNECGSNNKHFTKQTYYSQGNLVKYRIQLLQYTNSESTLVFSIQSNKILIQQVVNQVVDTYDILQLEILND